MKNKTFVYIIQSGIYFKIGWSKDPESRLKTFQQTIMPFDFDIIALYEGVDADRLERVLHNKYDSYRYRGEWFIFNEVLVYSIIRENLFTLKKAPVFNIDVQDEFNKKIDVLITKDSEYDKAIGLISNRLRMNLDVMKSFPKSKYSEILSISDKALNQEINKRKSDNNKELQENDTI